MLPFCCWRNIVWWTRKVFGKTSEIWTIKIWRRKKKVVWIWPRVSSGSMDKASDYLSVSITKKRRDKTLIHATFLCKKNINNKIHRFCSNFEIRGFLSLWARILLWWPGLPFYAKPINERHFLKLQNEHVGPIKIGFYKKNLKDLNSKDRI